MPEPAETRDVQPRWIVLAALGLALTIGLFAGGTALFLAHLPAPAEAAAPNGSIPGPHLQNDPVGDRKRANAHIDDELDGLAWVDRRNGIARIPIGRAMDLLVEQGWPKERTQ
jgi:hypothetical protein